VAELTVHAHRISPVLDDEVDGVTGTLSNIFHARHHHFKIFMRKWLQRKLRSKSNKLKITGLLISLYAPFGAECL
jgi:hypothetical protein